jgi:predicted house-cleaning noncanonical NTP pyrophosphatase (MazG superfamily)
MVRVSESKSQDNDFVFKKEIMCCWKTQDVVDEIILNHSSKVDTKARDKKGYEYSVLVNNVMAMLANDDLNAWANYLEVVYAQQKKK